MNCQHSTNRIFHRKRTEISPKRIYLCLRKKKKREGGLIYKTNGQLQDQVSFTWFLLSSLVACIIITWSGWRNKIYTLRKHVINSNRSDFFTMWKIKIKSHLPYNITCCINLFTTDQASLFWLVTIYKFKCRRIYVINIFNINSL